MEPLITLRICFQHYSIGIPCTKENARKIIEQWQLVMKGDKIGTSYDEEFGLCLNEVVGIWTEVKE